MSPLTTNINAPIDAPNWKTNSISLKLKDERIFKMISFYLSVTDCIFLNCSCKDLSHRAEVILWRPIAIRMGLNSTIEPCQRAIREIIEGKVSIETPERLLTSLSQHPQINYISQLKKIFTLITSDKLLFLFKQRTESGLTFLHLASTYNNFDFMMCVLTHIPDKHLEHCLNASTTNGHSPLLYSVAEKFNNSTLAIIQYATMKGKLHVLLRQRFPEKPLNFMQYICQYEASAVFVESILNRLTLEERQLILSIDTDTQPPLVIAAIHNHFDTFHTILNLVPLALFFSDQNKFTFLHHVCLNGIHTVFSHIDKHFTNHDELDANKAWTDLLKPRDTLKNKLPLFYLSELESESKALLVLKEIEKYVEDENCQQMVEESHLLHASIRKGAFDLASHIISNYPSLMKGSNSYGENIWHTVASVSSPAFFRKQLDFFNRYIRLYKKETKRIQLNQIDQLGQTPLSIALRNDLDELAACFIKQGASKSIHNSVYSTKAIAQHCSIKGMRIFKDFEYNLEGWSEKWALKEIYSSLKQFCLKHPDLKDLEEIFSILNLPRTQQLSAMKARAIQNKIWAKVLILKKEKSSHAITLIGSSHLVFVFNRASRGRTHVNENGESKIILLPPLLHIFIPPSGFCFDTMLSWDDGIFPSSYRLLDALTQFEFKPILDYPIKPQGIGNCVVVAPEGIMLPYTGLSKILQSGQEITGESIRSSLDSVKALYDEWRSFSHQRQIDLHKKSADPRVVAAIESVKLIRFAKKTIHHPPQDVPSLIAPSGLIQDDPYFPLRHYAWNALTARQQDFFTDVAQTSDRLEFIEDLVSSYPWLKEYFIKYIKNNKLNTLKPLIKQMKTKSSCLF